MSIATESNNRWRKKNRKVLQLTLLPEEKKLIETTARKNKLSMTAYIMQLIRRDNNVL